MVADHFRESAQKPVLCASITPDVVSSDRGRIVTNSSRIQLRGRHRRGRELPVVRWLQVGTAAAGLSMALLATPAVASADEGGSTADASSKSAHSPRSTAGANKAAKPTGSPAKRPKPTDTRTTETAAATPRARATSISTPVTQKAIVSEALKWAGFGNLGSRLPVPDAPVSDAVAAAWVGVRRFHYTYFNTRPTLNPTAYTQDINTGVITGNLGAYD